MSKDTVQVNSYIDQFLKSHEQEFDLMLGRIAQDIKRRMLPIIPVRSGNLISRIEVKRFSPRKYEVRIDEDYAAYQERGRRADGSHVVKKYTKPGTGKNFFKIAGKAASQNAGSQFKLAAARVKGMRGGK